MKKYNILFCAGLLLMAACAKEKAAPEFSRETEKPLMVCFSEDAFSRAYFQDEETGTLHWTEESIFLVGVPVEEDGEGHQTLHYELAVKSKIGNGGGGTGGWYSGDNEEEYQQDMRYYFHMDKTPHDFFTQYDKCQFFLIASGNATDSQYWLYTTLNGGYGVSGFGSSVDYLNLPYGGNDNYLFKTAVAQTQIDHLIGDQREARFRGYTHAQTICGRSAVLTEQEIIEEGGYAVTFTKLRLSNALLRFTVQTEDPSGLEMHTLRIKLVNTGDHSTETGWYQALSGRTYTDFSDYTNDHFTMCGAQHLLNQGVTEDLSSELSETYDEILLQWSTANGLDDGSYYSYTVGTTPLDRYFYACILPQTEFLEDSYLQFEILNEAGAVVSSVRKQLPAEGLQPGTRYDFALTFPEFDPNLGTGAGNAGSYTPGTL